MYSMQGVVFYVSEKIALIDALNIHHKFAIELFGTKRMNIQKKFQEGV